MKRRLDAILLAVAGMLFLLVGYERNAIDSERKPSIFSTYDTGPKRIPRALRDSPWRGRAGPAI